ncbi:MAG: MarR family transcriptional regulator [Longimicrobiales bacterium]
MNDDTLAALECVTDGARAAALVQHPLRRWILAGARHPVSATELANTLGLTRQRVNYHVRQLERAGYLRPAGRKVKRNLVERKYVATARSYVLLPQLLGPLAATVEEGADRSSASYLLGLTSMAQQELAAVAEAAGRAGKRMASESLMTELLFEDEAQRAAFGKALRAAVAEVLAEYSAPLTEMTQRGERPFRLVIGCYPIPEPGRHD